MTATVAFVTYSDAPGLTADDTLAANELGARGLHVRAVPWDSASVQWSDFQLIVLRSCWNYHRRATEFVQWIEKIGANGGALENSAETVLWNLDKHYLLKLERGGVTIVPTEYVKRGERKVLAELLEQRGWTRAVVKPAVSATAFKTFLTGADRDADQQAFEDMVRNGGVLVQVFREEIQRLGEWSFMFFGGAFSHAVMKHALAGDFRVQEEFGGTVTIPPPDSALIAEAGKTLTALAADTLYARVDAVPVGGSLELMELELIEPALFLKHSEQAAARFADAVEQRIAGKAG